MATSSESPESSSPPSYNPEVKDSTTLKVNNDSESDQASGVRIGEIYGSPEIHKSITRKLDVRLLPLLSLMYLFNAIDRSNLGNAKTDGLEDDLGMTGNEYSITLVLFYITFCLLDLPSNMLLKRFSGKVMLPTLMLGWGSMTLIQCAVHNWGGLIACRLLMGAFEAGFMAGVIYYLTTFYRRGELAFRVSIFYGSATIAGAFSGLIAYGVFQIKDSKIPGRKYLMIVEGSSTILLSLYAYWHLPANVISCDWFTEEEKLVAEQRMLRDGSQEVTEEFNIKKALGFLRDWKVAVYACIGLSYGVAGSSVGNFLPQMVALLGFSTIKTNLYTVAPYVVGTVVLLLTCYSSDHFRERSYHLAATMCLTFVGYIILISINTETHKGPAYFACFLLTAGAFTPSCIFHTWHNNNEPSENARAAQTGFMVGAANSGGIVSSLAFTAKSAPRYMPALIVTGVFQAVGIVLVLSFGAWCRWDNARRDREQGTVLKSKDVATEALEGGTNDPSWRWTA